MLINTYFSPLLKEEERQFEQSIAVMVDVLRASTTVCAALFNGAKEIIPTENSEQAMRIFNDLDRSIRFIGGEKNLVKHAGFDAGNSPLEYTTDKCLNKTIILTTTNGSKLFTLVKTSKQRFVASFANFSVIFQKLKSLLEENKTKEDIQNINFFCAGNNGQFSYEDTLCIGGLIYKITKELDIPFELSDSTDAARNLFDYHQDNLFEFLLNSEHSRKLISAGFQSDLDICLAYDTFPIIPIIDGISIKKSII
jgi:2-phosphosulfolactate phosphatase